MPTSKLTVQIDDRYRDDSEKWQARWMLYDDDNIGIQVITCYGPTEQAARDEIAKFLTPEEYDKCK